MSIKVNDKYTKNLKSKLHKVVLIQVKREPHFEMNALNLCSKHTRFGMMLSVC